MSCAGREKSAEFEPAASESREAGTRTKEYHLRRFAGGARENAQFWERLGEKPDFSGARVLEIGSGWGSLAIEAALAGASRVVGLDLKPDLVAFAADHVREAFPELEGKVHFFCLELKEVAEGDFDLALAKDTFEHVLDLEGLLRDLAQRLRPGGRVYAGFGPLYWSPYGDHDRRRVAFRHLGLVGRALAAIPWGHLFFERAIVRAHNRARGGSAASMRDLGLNRMPFREYRAIFLRSGFEIVKLLTNRGLRGPARIFRLLSRFRPFEDYATVNVYCVLEKRRSSHQRMSSQAARSVAG